jgi:hypothetical protein
MAMDKGKGTLRDWYVDSYGPTNGRALSSNGGNAPGSKEGGSSKAGKMATANAGGQNGAPGVSAMNKSGSADPGRRKWGGTELP